MQNIIKKILICLPIFFSALAFSQLSKTHYIPPLTSAEFGNANPEEQYIYISTPSAGNINYTIIPVGQPPTANINGNVSNANPDEIALGSGNGQLFIPSAQTSTVVNNRGFIIEAEAPVYVSVRMNAGGGSQAGALVSKGQAALGTTFRVGAYTNENPQDNYLNFVSVMATENNTRVEFGDIPNNLTLQNYTGPIPIPPITLQKGESYTLAANSLISNPGLGELIGTVVTSDKPIVVNCGSANGSFGGGGGRDYGIDQIVDVSKVGTEYILVKGNGENDWENVLIVAHSNNTSIQVNGGPIVATINAGDYYLIEGDQFTGNGNMYVETSEPVFVYQGVGATTSEANQGMFFVPPLSCEARGNLDNIANIGNIGNTVYTGGVTIVTKVGATVTINNTPVGNFNTQGPYNVAGKPDYITYKVTGLAGNISVESSDELYAAYFNFNGAATSGSFYSGFPSAPEINFDSQFTTLGNCIPNITLSAANTQSFDSFEWWFDDGSGIGFINLNISTIDFTPTIPGRYKLIGVITCTLERLESAEVPISICPDDSDNDGIIDNIDVDNDNDGIQNCAESNGNVVLNIANTTNPQLIFQDNTVNTTLASGVFTQTNSQATTTNTFSGTTDGNFTSVVQASVSGENEYEMSFAEAINFEFSEAIATTHISVDGEFFIAKVSPVDKNITLLDPDQRLLVDSNFDGAFETGVTQISGSEIHFKINPNPTGNTPYRFLANSVTGFSFIHRLANNLTASTFTGTLALTCYKKDTDNDGIIDELDADSDNDGITDIIENQGENTVLSNTDTDLNGLDDVFDLNDLPIDSDNDSVPDFYDLDSDNDGVYDLEESNSGAPDTNFDGVIDNANTTTVGTNGLFNGLETTPDSFILSYTLSDLDGDLIFNYIDVDSDGDLCTDVIEAGFSDANNDGFLGDAGILIDANGIVSNAPDGYTLPNTNYLIDGTITISTQPVNTEVCENATTSIDVIATPITDAQWEISTDSGVTWTALIDSGIYTNTTTTTLNISAVPLTFNNNQYRVFLNSVENSCGLYSDAITLTVNPLPIITNNVTLVQCDDDDAASLGFSAFNLTEANENISINFANETFSYFTTAAAAILGDENSAAFIANPTTYVNPTVNSSVVWARINSSFGCASVSEIQLNVSTTQIPLNFLRTFNVCDDLLDLNGDDNQNNDNRDGIATFDFSSVTNEVLALFPVGQNPTVHYYRSEADALSEANEILNTTNYRNIGFPNNQNIFVRVESDISNDCLGLGAPIQLTVEALPIANPVTIPRQCDDDQDGLFPFDTSTIEAQLLNGQNPANVIISYTDENGNALPSPLPNPFLTASQTVTIRVTNAATADPNGACFEETTVAFVVDQLPIANPIAPQIVCDGDAGDVDDDGLFAFDTSTFRNTLLGTQTGMEVYFSYTDETGTLIDRSITLPNPLISASQTINVSIENPINVICNATTEIDLVVNPLPEFTIDDSLIACTSDPTFTVLLDPTEANPTENFTYEWIFEDDPTLVIATTPTLTVSNPGVYFITLTKTDGTLCSRTREIFVNASELATITLDDIQITDLSSDNTVTITNENQNLGQGSYEFALEDVNSTLADEAFFQYQESTTFNNVLPGIYQLYVRDQNGCGTAVIQINIIGYLKFFTPNNDGVNDFWQILGIDTQFQANTVISVFDRFGKLITQIQPNSQGWDGTFNGQALPASDYWFSANLEDGRAFKGHFSLKR
ncbi:MAG: T9SS type B sorting domain-containing protein [Cellulophaga sp.]|nr:T9SS type B sorting domain-containing protein [Cellulophaga sp.]